MTRRTRRGRGVVAPGVRQQELFSRLLLSMLLLYTATMNNNINTIFAEACRCTEVPTLENHYNSDRNIIKVKILRKRKDEDREDYNIRKENRSQSQYAPIIYEGQVIKAYNTGSSTNTDFVTTTSDGDTILIQTPGHSCGLQHLKSDSVMLLALWNYNVKVQQESGNDGGDDGDGGRLAVFGIGHCDFHKQWKDVSEDELYILKNDGTTSESTTSTSMDQQNHHEQQQQQQSSGGGIGDGSEEQEASTSLMLPSPSTSPEAGEEKEEDDDGEDNGEMLLQPALISGGTMVSPSNSYDYIHHIVGVSFLLMYFV